MVDSPRVRKLRSEIINSIPRVPNNKASRSYMESQPTSWLISTFVTWRQRQVPAKPRRVSLWSGGITPSDFEAAKPRLRGLLQKVETGQDLTPHLSYLVDTKGVILPGASPADKGKDLDAVLTRYGMHHFHVGEITLQNPKGRSGTLVFAEVADSGFRIVAIAGHHAFTLGTVEQQTLSRICTAYCTRDIPRGSGFMLSPVMSSGHSAIIMMFGMKCKAEIERLDPLLDDASFVDQLYSQRPILRDGQTVGRPAKPSLGWHFNDLAFGILDRKTMVFFNLLPYFAR
jgi:hypothetical protein